MNQAQVMDMNVKARERNKEYVLDHIEVHPEKGATGRPVEGGGHVVHSIHREAGEEYGRSRRAEKPFGAGDHEEMLAHVANELKLPEPREDDGEKEGKGGAAGAAY